MECIELRIPPLPQFITVGHADWRPGMRHFTRSFNVFDMLIVKSGALYMSEDDRSYDITAGHVLVLEPNRTHWGHRDTDVMTELYWVHFVHASPIRPLSSDEIPWSYLLRRGTDFDDQPGEQYMYVPKFARIDLTPIIPVLDRMVAMYEPFSTEQALPMHALLAELLMLLQASIRSEKPSRSAEVSRMAMAYLQQLDKQTFHAREMAEQLHYHFDYITRCLKKHTGMTPLEYVRHIRVNKAKALLENTAFTVQEIGERVGWDNANYFIRLFRKSTGLTPGQYRELKYRGGQAPVPGAAPE